MAWTNPRTWADGYVVTAADLNEQVRDNMVAVDANATTALATANQGHQILTTAQKTALTGVTTGTMVYDSTIGVVQSWNGTSWQTPFPYLYSSETYLLDSTTTTKDILWPSGFRNITIEVDVINIGTTPTVTWQFLESGTPLSASSYSRWVTNLQVSYSSTSSTVTNVDFYGAGRFTKWSIALPDAAMSQKYPSFEGRFLGGNQIIAGSYNTDCAPTGMRLTRSGSPTANITFRSRVVVQS
jgi:hypothetical protein